MPNVADFADLAAAFRAARGENRPPRVYRPAAGAYVVGVVEDRGAEGYRVALPGAAVGGVLPALAFDGATKRNRPRLEIGDAVYCRVKSVPPGGEADLTCCAARGPRREWMTGAATFGKLWGDGPEAALAAVPASFASQLLERDAPVLHALAKHVKYEVAIGLNGCVWLRAASTLDAVIVANSIENAAHLDEAEAVAAMVDQIVDAMRARTARLCGDADAHDDADGDDSDDDIG